MPLRLAALNAPFWRGHLETLDIHGLSDDGRVGYWLRHALVRDRASRQLTLDLTTVLFQRAPLLTRAVHVRDKLDRRLLTRIGAHGWSGFTHALRCGSFVEMTDHGSRGRLHSPDGQAGWHFYRPVLTSAKREALWPPEVLWPWPSQQRPGAMPFQALARLNCQELGWEGRLTGLARHGWGWDLDEEYAHATCTAFRHEPAWFEGFSSRSSLVGDWLPGPVLSAATLVWQDQRYHFPEQARPTVSRHALHGLSDYAWQIVFRNDRYRLEVDIDGGNPRLEPWVALHVGRPGGQRRVLKHSPFAAGCFRLYREAGNELLVELRSERVTLETSRPENLPSGRGAIGIT